MMLGISLRIRIRTLMIMIAASAVLVIFWMTQFGTRTLSIGSGQLHISIIVIDNTNRRPVCDACIVKVDLDSPENGTPVIARTDQWGRAATVEERLFYGSSDNFGEASATVHYPLWGFRVTREGYKTTEIIMLRDRIGLSADPNAGGLKPAAIVVELQRDRVDSGK